MTEFWKSNPRKFCDYCRVWFADNKSSINYHERGRKHQENVERKLGELRRKGLKQHEEQKKTNSYLQQMEEDALKAFKKDAQEDSSLVSQYNDAAVELKVRQFQEQAENDETRKPTKPAEGTWYEGKNDEGHSYYWNNVTGVSQWDEPEEFVPHKDSSANMEGEKPAEEEKEKEGEGEKDKEGEEEEDEDASSSENEEAPATKDASATKNASTTKDAETEKESPRKGQKRKSDAYGGWTTVVKVERAPIDLELPTNNQTFLSHYQPQVEQRQPREEIEFGTKTVTSLGPGTSTGKTVGFKKRKARGGGRSLRQREET